MQQQCRPLYGGMSCDKNTFGTQDMSIKFYGIVVYDLSITEMVVAQSFDITLASFT
jgi:hypothetical protein